MTQRDYRFDHMGIEERILEMSLLKENEAKRLISLNETAYAELVRSLGSRIGYYTNGIAANGAFASLTAILSRQQSEPVIFVE